MYIQLCRLIHHLLYFTLYGSFHTYSSHDTSIQASTSRPAPWESFTTLMYNAAIRASYVMLPTSARCVNSNRLNIANCNSESLGGQRLYRV